MAHDVFISYSVRDKTVADAVCATLEGRKIRCWIAPRDVLPGKIWGEAIIEGLEQSRLMVLVFSSSSNNSSQVMREVERAVNKGIPVIPFRVEDVPLSKSMEYFISAAHWLDALSPPLEVHLQKLADAVGALLAVKGEEEAQPVTPVVAVPEERPERAPEKELRRAEKMAPRRTWLAWGLIPIALIVLGYSVLVRLTRQSLVPKPTPTAVAVPKGVYTPTLRTPLAKEVLLEDNFSDPKSGWDTRTTDKYEVGYKNGEYRTAVRAPNYEAWTLAAQKEEWSDFVIEVDARRVAGPLDNDYGLVVRHRAKPEGFYMFLVSSDGWYSVQIWQGDQSRELVGWTEAKAIRKGEESNRLMVECVGSRMRFYANGALLVAIQDETLRAGRVGLVVGTFDEGGVVVHFDNLRVRTAP